MFTINYLAPSSLITFISKGRVLTLTLVCLIALSFQACSSSSDGFGDGDSDSLISDQDLALGSSDARYGQGNIPIAASRESGPFSDIHFGFDASSIDPSYQGMLRSSAEELIKDPSLKAEIEGHCDSRGTHEYNLALGEERAKAVMRALVQNGANQKQLSIISYGEEIPLDPAQNEAAYAKNRRAHFALFKNKTR